MKEVFTMYNSKANLSNSSCFDYVRKTHGTDSMAAAFCRSIKANSVKAAVALNNDSLSFTSFFSLMDEIKKSDIYPLLSKCLQHALEIWETIDKKEDTYVRHVLKDRDSDTFHCTCKWMLETGYSDDGLSPEFDKLLDSAAIILLKSFKDNSVLPMVAELIFARHRRGGFIFNLVWGFFEYGDPQSLYLIASKLRSNHWDDVELAKRLLNFIPVVRSGLSTDCDTLYLQVIAWLRSNIPFMEYTGESCQQSSNPVPYVVLSAKKRYLEGLT